MVNGEKILKVIVVYVHSKTYLITNFEWCGGTCLYFRIVDTHTIHTLQEKKQENTTHFPIVSFKVYGILHGHFVD